MIRKAILRNLLLPLLCLFASALAQTYRPYYPYDLYGSYDSGVYGIADKHFHGILFPEVYKNMPSAKINYPGLWTSDNNSASVGLLPDLLGGDGLNGLYGWVDIYNTTGSLGLWFGNFYAGSGYRVHEYDGMLYFWESSDLTMRGAVWITPQRNDVVRGISVAFDIDNTYAYNGNSFDGLININSFYVNINALFSLSDKYSLRAGIRTRNRHADDANDKRFDNSKFFKDGLNVSLIDDRLRTLELWAENAFAVNYGDEKRDTVSVGLRYSQGWTRSYMKHVFFFGINAETGVWLPSKIDQDAGSFQYVHYMQNLTGEGRVMRAGVTVPLILDVSLFRSLRGMLSIAPRIEYLHIAPLRDVENLPFPPEERVLYRRSQNSFDMGIPNAEISFRGHVGDRFDFSIRPSLLSNEAFISALEIRYRF